MLLNGNIPTDSTIHISLDKPHLQPDQKMQYRPWGTRTIKFHFTTEIDLPRLSILPKNRLQQDMDLGIFHAYADNDPSLTLTWGGGHERGPNLKSKDVLSAFESSAPLQANESSYAYFQLTHSGNPLPDQATVTFTTRPDGTEEWNPNITALNRFSIQLVLPTHLPPAEQISRIIPDAQGNSWSVYPGQYLPAYDSRWWPAKEIVYLPCDPPPIQISIVGRKLIIRWNLGDEPIAILEDYTDPPVMLLGGSIAFDLFMFDECTYVLRVWFMWVDKFIGEGRFVHRHEIPDVERFDMIIRRKDGRVILACTDLHWHEVWARVLPGKILHATLGMPREIALNLAREKLSEVWNELWAMPARLSNKGIDHIAQSNNNPVEPYIRRLASREATVTLKATGMEAHLPTLHNVEQRRPAVMTSSDVRLG